MSRKASESIQVGDEIIVSVVRIEGDRVRIGISAPIEIRVVRAELLQAVANENLRAAQRPAVPPFPLLDLKPIAESAAGAK